MMMVIESKDSIDAANAELKSIFNKETKVWVNTNVSQRGKKPKAKTGVCQTLACYCSYSNCFMQTSGEDCATCLQFHANDALVGTVQDPHGGEGDLKCTCQICQCPCVVTYLRSQIQAIGFQLEETNGKRNNRKHLNRMSFFPR
jgi:hypothetical protein